MSGAIQNLVISLGAMQLARKIPFENPDVLNYVRIGYVASQVIVIGVYYFVAAKIRRKNDQTILKYVEPKNAMTDDPPKLVTITYRDYDLQETTKLLRAAWLGVAMMGFLHIYMKFTQPLFVQALMGVKALYEAKPVSIHLLNKPAEGDLKRPFKGPANMFGGGGDVATDKAAIDEAEKKAVTAKKDE